MKDAPSFTLLELILVITIMGIMTSAVILDFAGVRERQQVSLLADKTVAVLQQSRGDVQGGKVRTETLTDGTEEKIYLCEGVFFELNTDVLFAKADFDPVAQSCDMSTLVTEDYGLSSGGAFTETISAAAVSLSSLYVLYAPPDGSLFLYSDGGELSGDSEFTFNHTSEVELELSVRVSYQTGLVSLSIGKDEEI